jgi:hypothetical protein
VMAMSGLVVATVILAQEFGTLSPRRAVAAARGAANEITEGEESVAVAAPAAPRPRAPQAVTTG